MHFTNYHPELTLIIDVIEEETTDETLVGVYLAYDVNDEFGEVIRFYTFRQINTGLPPDKGAEIMEETLPGLYIYCNRDAPNTVPDVFLDFEYTIISDTCKVFHS